MKGYRFYLEYPNETEKNKPYLEGDHDGNVLALLLDENNRPISHPTQNGYAYECIAAVHFHENSGVAGTSISPDILENQTKRISEEKAREIHPRLFEWLDHAEEMEGSYA